jgi:hypothetical protein
MRGGAGTGILTAVAAAAGERRAAGCAGEGGPGQGLEFAVGGLMEAVKIRRLWGSGQGQTSVPTRQPQCHATCPPACLPAASANRLGRPRRGGGFGLERASPNARSLLLN